MLFDAAASLPLRGGAQCEHWAEGWHIPETPLSQKSEIFASSPEGEPATPIYIFSSTSARRISTRAIHWRFSSFSRNSSTPAMVTTRMPATL